MKKISPDHDMKKMIMGYEALSGTDLEIEKARYVFTEDEKRALKRELDPVIKAAIKNAIAKYEIDNAHDLLQQKLKDDLQLPVDLFLNKLEEACNWMMWMKHAPSRQDHRDKLADMLKSFKKTVRYLKQIYEMDVYIPLKREITRPLFPSTNPVANILAKESVVAARKAEQHLEAIIKIIEKYQRPKIAKGSPGTYTTELAISAAHAYYIFFRVKPTTYFDGPFVKIFRRLIDILGLDYKDNSRAISAAIKSVEKEFNL